MNKKLGTGLFVMGVLAGCAGDDGDGNEPRGAGSAQSAVSAAAVVSSSELARMTSFVKHRIDPSSVRLSLQTQAGRRVDCVGRYDQPALNKLRGLALEAPPQELGAPALSAAELAARGAIGPERL